MIDRLIAEDIRILTVPPFNDLGKEGMQIKDIQIEDLLQRDPIHVDIRKNIFPYRRKENNDYGSCRFNWA